MLLLTFFPWDEKSLNKSSAFTVIGLVNLFTSEGDENKVVDWSPKRWHSDENKKLKKQKENQMKHFNIINLSINHREKMKNYYQK